MPKSQTVCPVEVRKKGIVSIPEIPINAYKASASKEKKKYGVERLARMQYDMRLIREFETSLNELKVQGNYQGIEYNHKGPAHLSIGQEPLVVGQSLPLTVDDFIFGSHRSHGEILAKCMSAIWQLDDAALTEVMEGFQGGEPG